MTMRLPENTLKVCFQELLGSQMSEYRESDLVARGSPVSIVRLPATQKFANGEHPNCMKDASRNN